MIRAQHRPVELHEQELFPLIMIDRRPFDCVFNHPDGVLGWWMCVSEDGLSDNTHSQRASRPPSSESATDTHSPAQPCEDGCCRHLATETAQDGIWWDFKHFHPFSPQTGLINVIEPQGDSRNRRSQAGGTPLWNTWASLAAMLAPVCSQKQGNQRDPSAVGTLICWLVSCFCNRQLIIEGGGANPPQSTKITGVLSAINHLSAAFQSLCSFTPGADDVAVKKNYILNQ